MSRQIRRTVRVLLAIGMLVVSAHRLPAPIVEETPTPKPKAKSSRASAENRPKKSAASKPASTKVSVAGTWTGTASGRINQAVFGQTSFSSNYKIQISADERMADWTSSAWIFAKFQAPVQKNGRTLNWTTERNDIAGATTVNCRLEMESNGAARYSESSGLVNGIFKGAGYEISGILIRQ